AGGEQRRVFHAAGAALKRRIDNRDVTVRVGAEPLAVVLQRRARGIEMPFSLTLVLRLQQQAHLDGGQRWMFEAGGSDEVIGARGPREIVDVLLIEAVHRVTAVVAPLALDAGRSDRPAGRRAQ